MCVSLSNALKCFMENSNFSYFVKSIISIIFLTGLLYLLFFAEAEWFRTRSWVEIWNLGHIALFLGFGCLFYKYHKNIQQKKLIIQMMLISSAGIIFGALIEIIQHQFGREASLSDLMLDLFGANLSVILCSDKFKKLYFRIKAAYYFMIVLLTIILLHPLASVMVDEFYSYKEFPVLSGFDNTSEIGRWSGDAKFVISGDVKLTGKSSLKIILNKVKYSGVELQYFPDDWLLYDELSFHVYNPDKKLFKLNVTIYDEKCFEAGFKNNDRYNGQFFIKSGWNDVRINLDKVRNSPYGRKMDMSSIYGMYFFVENPVDNQVFYLDDVRLY